MILKQWISQILKMEIFRLKKLISEKTAELNRLKEIFNSTMGMADRRMKFTEEPTGPPPPPPPPPPEKVLEDIGKKLGVVGLEEGKDGRCAEGLKKIYYSIATLTHPDKVADPEKNELFKKASKAWEDHQAKKQFSVMKTDEIVAELSREHPRSKLGLMEVLGRMSKLLAQIEELKEEIIQLNIKLKSELAYQKLTKKRIT